MRLRLSSGSYAIGGADGALVFGGDLNQACREVGRNPTRFGILVIPLVAPLPGPVGTGDPPECRAPWTALAGGLRCA